MDIKHEIKTTTANSTYPKVAVQWLNQALCFYQSLCLVDSFVLRIENQLNPPEYKARNDASQLSKLIHEKITKNIVSILGNFCYLCGDV
jgi:hypothetical protein